MRIPHVSPRSVLEQCAIVGIIVLVVLLVGGSWRLVKVTGWSMHPALHPGDLVLVHKTREVRTGDVILFQAPGHGMVLHRAVGVARDGSIRTQGDFNDIADRDSAQSADVLGRVSAVAPVGRIITRWRDADACATMTVQSNNDRR